jgi:hypothetical protein
LADPDFFLGKESGGDSKCRRLDEVFRFSVTSKKGLYFVTKGFVTLAGLIQKGRSFARFTFECRMEKLLDKTPTLLLHRCAVQSSS